MEVNILPRHVAVIMDGNGRWAKQKNMPRIAGHQAGVRAVRTVVKTCAKKHIEVLTLFAFSSENWKRPENEVNYLMKLFLSFLRKEARKLNDQNIQLRIMGDRSRFSEKLQIQMQMAEVLTAKNTGLKLFIAANYGGRWDIQNAISQVLQAVVQGKLPANKITSDLINHKLATFGLPVPDLLIRTSGEQRISNFLLWPIENTELYFTPLYWPDFNAEELEKAFAVFAHKHYLGTPLSCSA